MARQMKAKKEPLLAQAAGAAMGIGAAYMMGKDKGLWGKTTPAAVDTTTSAERTALLNAQAGALEWKDANPTAGTPSRYEAGPGDGMLGPATTSPSTFSKKGPSQATANAPSRYAMSDASRGALASDPPQSAPGVQSFSTVNDSMAEGTSGRALDVSPVVQNRSGFAAAPPPVPITNPEMVSRAMQFGGQGSNSRLRRADGGKIGSAGPVRSFPKKGK